ncbi:GNAT family N-acetyltransferase [Micrococcaceae bacterium Sec5.7]
MTAITFENASQIQRDEVVELYESVGWMAYTVNPDLLLGALQGSHSIVTARDDGRLVGLARAISDGVSIVYLQDILVRPTAQRQGVGRQLVSILLGAYEGVRQKVLITDVEEKQRAFYESLGFTESHDHDPGIRAFVHFTN